MIRDRLDPRRYLSRLGHLARQPVFVFLTIWGHVWILGLAGLFFHFEDGNPGLQSYFDALYWAISTVTTVGFGDIHATTSVGKVISILLMLFGSLFLWSYVGLIVAAFISPDVREMERELTKLETQEKRIEQLISRLEKLLAQSKN
ncbi:MAG: two pore domain potassium channel family protein [Bdellovibrionales bacterium]|nr:two pore domain potassium channel family protein [Bdellovibrionales bacterium]